MVKKYAYAKQHSEAEHLLFENYLRSSYTLSSKNGYILKNKQKSKCISVHEIKRLTIKKWRWKWKIDHIDAT